MTWGRSRRGRPFRVLRPVDVRSRAGTVGAVQDPDRHQPRRRDPYHVVLFAAAVTVAVLLAPRMLPVFMAVVLTTLFAIALDAPVAALARRGVPRALGTMVVVGAVLAGVGVLVAAVAPALTHQLAELSDQHGDLRIALIDRANEVLSGLAVPVGPVPDTAGERLANQIMGMSIVRDTGAFLGVAVLSFFCAIYAVSNPRPLQRRLLMFVAPARREQVCSVAEAVAARLRRWAVGQTILNLAVGLASYGLFRSLGVPFAAVFAVMAAVLESLPTIGIMLSSAGPVLLVLLNDPSDVVWLLAGIFAIQQVQDRAISPTVMRRAVDIPQTVLMLVIFASALLLGPVGVLVAVPLLAAAFTVHDELRRHHLLGDDHDDTGPLAPCPGDATCADGDDSITAAASRLVPLEDGDGSTSDGDGTERDPGDGGSGDAVEVSSRS